MSDSKTSPSDGGNKAAKRNLPSWMSSREDEGKSRGMKTNAVGVHEESNEGETRKHAKGHGRAHTGSTFSKGAESSKNSAASSILGAMNFSKLLEGVVFVLSGFVNPERSILRSQGMEMGAEYQSDWNSDCTLLVCAFPNTPKFRQVEADCGTIVSKEWISECYTQKKLIDIESYLMHAGKPWRRSNISHEASQDQETSQPRKSQKQVERASHSKPTASASSKNGTSNPAKEHFSPSEVKKWAIDDLNKTISWLESQEEKPEASEMKKIAAEGILTCLQDAIDCLEQQQDIRKMTEQWNFIPRVVDELVKLEFARNNSASLPKGDLYRQAMACKQIYDVELNKLDDDSLVKKKKAETNESEGADKRRIEVISNDAAAYDSDETIEMTEDEIDLAYKTIASKICKC